jgi:hypothetical protein
LFVSLSKEAQQRCLNERPGLTARADTDPDHLAACHWV